MTVTEPRDELVFGGEAAGSVALPLASIQSETVQAGRVKLDVPLESLGDSWGILRAVWDRVAEGGILTVVYGHGGSFRLSKFDVDNLLRLAGFDPAARSRFQDGGQTTARKVERVAAPLSCTVVVPCRNEVDNVGVLVDRVPALGTSTEILFVDGDSTDGTPERILELIRRRHDGQLKLIRQSGNTGKGGATFQGLRAATGDVVMILDADMTVRPEDLPRFYLALAEGVADFANGTRLIYPMDAGAMPGLNNVGNRAFSHYLSWLLGQRITDTLCGTKAVFKRDVPKLLDARPQFGGHDPWGDFDLLMGAGLLDLRVIDVPIRYVAREAGESKMRPWSHGMALAQTCAVGALRLKLGGRGRGRAG